MGVKFVQQLDDSIDIQALAANDVFSPLDASNRRGWSLGRACTAQPRKLLRAAMAQSVLVLVTCPGAGWTMMHLGRGPGARLASFYQAALHLPP